MKRKLLFIGLGLVVTAAFVLLGVEIFRPVDIGSPNGEKNRDSRITHKSGAVKPAAKHRKIVRIDENSKLKELRQSLMTAGASTNALPSALPGVIDPEEQLLTELARALLKDVQHALDTGSLSALRKVIARIRACRKDELGGNTRDGIPAVVKRRIASALATFGAAGTSDLLPLLVDEDTSVSQFALSQFEMTLLDFNMSDAERAEVVVQASTVLTDESTVNRIMWNLLQTRHSVGVKAFVDISQTGTPQAQQALDKVVEMYTNGSRIETVEDLQQWLKSNPDGSYDDMLYGGVKTATQEK